MACDYSFSKRESVIEDLITLQFDGNYCDVPTTWLHKAAKRILFEDCTKTTKDIIERNVLALKKILPVCCISMCEWETWFYESTNIKYKKILADDKNEIYGCFSKEVCRKSLTYGSVALCKQLFDRSEIQMKMKDFLKIAGEKQIMNRDKILEWYGNRFCGSNRDLKLKCLRLLSDIPNVGTCLFEDFFKDFVFDQTGCLRKKKLSSRVVVLDPKIEYEIHWLWENATGINALDKMKIIINKCLDIIGQTTVLKKIYTIPIDLLENYIEILKNMGFHVLEYAKYVIRHLDRNKTNTFLHRFVQEIDPFVDQFFWEKYTKKETIEYVRCCLK